MRKFIFFLLGVFLITSLQPNISFAFSITKPASLSEMIKYENGSEFVKLSFKEFVTLTGQKTNLWNRLSFNRFKNKVKHDLVKNPTLTMTQYYPKALRTAGKVLYIIILLIMVLLIVIGISLKK